MKRMSKILSLLLALCLTLSVSAFASGEPSAEPSGEPSLAGTYTDGTHTLVINDDLTFTMEKTGLNLEAEEFTMLVTGIFSEDGTFVIDGLYDGEINLVEVASADQLAADEATVAAAFAGGKVGGSGEAAGSDWDAYIAYLTELVNTDPTMDLYEQFMRELAEAQEVDYQGMLDGTLYGAIAFSFGAMSYEDFQAQN